MRFRKWLALAILLTSLARTQAGSVEIVKTWKFNLPGGSLKVELRAFTDGSSSLGIAPYGQAPAAPIAEQVGPLKQILGEMPSLGLDPRKLEYLGTRLFGRDVYEKLAYACADSPEWRSSMKNGGKGKEKLVVTLLNRSGAFEAYNEAFKAYGIQVQVTEAEKVGLMHFSKVPARNEHDRGDARVWVPADAMLGMRFSPIDTNPSDEKK
jgi:hypothetical protein